MWRPGPGAQKSSPNSSYCHYFMSPSEMRGYFPRRWCTYDIFFCVFSYRCYIVGFFKTVVWHSHLLQVGSLRFVFCIPYFLLCCWNPCTWAGPRLCLCVNYPLALWPAVFSPAGSTVSPAQSSKASTPSLFIISSVPVLKVGTISLL